jgi:hypothetical protein
LRGFAGDVGEQNLPDRKAITIFANQTSTHPEYQMPPLPT